MAARKRTLRCFVGLPLPSAWQEGLGRVTRLLSGALSSRISWTRPGNWHLTLKFLGDVDQELLPDLSRALRGVAFAPFALAVGRTGIFPPVGRGAPRVLWAGLGLGEAQSLRLAAEVEQALVPLGFAPEARPFAAHLTLGRVKEAAKDDDWALLEGIVAGEDWPRAEAGCFALWQSVLGPGGPQYSRLAEFPARTGPA